MDWREYIKNELSQLSKSTSFHDTLPVNEKSLLELKERFNLDELPAELEQLYRQTNPIHEKLDGKTLAKFWEKGKELSFDDAIAFAMEEA